MIHGGAQDWMWGHAVCHSMDSYNCRLPANPVAGKEGISRLRLSQPTITAENERRNHKPFLSLCFKTQPEAYRLKDFGPRAQACVVLRYMPNKKGLRRPFLT